MSGIKLEVGKTYRSRNGDEVSIVEKGGGLYVFRGSDDERYTESGRFDISVAESECDLIEEVKEVPETRHIFTIPNGKEITAARYTFKIPDGTKGINVSKEGNRLVVEMVPEDKGPKPGDIVFEDGRIMIVKKYPNLYHAMIHGNPDYLHINGSYGIPFTSATFRLATAEEAQLLFDALKKAGKRWNPDTLKIEELTERERIMDFVQRYANNVTWNYEQLCWLIEDYLKHKEAKMSKTLQKE